MNSPTTLILFGATGDLAQNKLFPALLQLLLVQKTLDNLNIVAIGRREYSREQFLEQVRSNLSSSDDLWIEFSEHIQYYRLDYFNKEEFKGLQSFLPTDKNRVFYLSVPPEHYEIILENLDANNFCDSGSIYEEKVVIEKPFGKNLETARVLNATISDLVSEKQVYKIDHYLGKETVQNILAFRFANSVFETSWSAAMIDHIQITVAEDEGVKTRGAFYDSNGAFRDIVQNHILQLLTLVTMDEPESLSSDQMTRKKDEILKSIRVDFDQTLIGQYAGYLEESQVNPQSRTETFAMTCLYCDLPRWQGVPIYIRTGKALSRKISEISIQFKKSNSILFAEQAPNSIHFRLQPDEGISLRLDVKSPRESAAIQPVKMEFCYSSTFRAELPDAYELIFLDVLSGSHLHSLSASTIEESWKIVDQILERTPHMKLHTYEQGSWGPERSHQILEETGRRWHADESTVCNGVILEESAHINSKE